MLSAEQIAARKGKLTGSRIGVLMSGNAAAVNQLYLEMIGEAVEPDLSRYWPVRLGEATEQLQLDWFSEKNGLPVTRRGEVVVHSKLSWAACTLDGWVEDGGADYPIEAKHTGGREPLEIVLDRYAPQLHWIMCVTGAQEIALSVIMGANEPIIEYVDQDLDYIAEMIRRGERFMQCVLWREPPVGAPPPVSAPIDASKVYDMDGNNEWASSAKEWLDSRLGFEKCRDAEKVLKSLVPADAKKCTGYGVRISRDRAGRLSLRADA